MAQVLWGYLFFYYVSQMHLQFHYTFNNVARPISFLERNIDHLFQLLYELRQFNYETRHRFRQLTFEFKLAAIKSRDSV